MTHRTRIALTLAASLSLIAAAGAQEVVRKEAPPEIKQLIGAVVQAVNGTADDFEKFAQDRFAPELLKKHGTADRAALHRKFSEAFGQIGINGVRREGPDAPLQLLVKGSKSDGTITVDIDSSNPPKIVSIQ